MNLAHAAHALGKRREARDALVEAIERARTLGYRKFLVDGLINAAAIVVANDPSTATLLLAAADRAQTDLTIELDPVERDLRASVQTQLPHRLGNNQTGDVAAGDLDSVLDTAATRALQSLADLDDKVRN